MKKVLLIMVLMFSVSLLVACNNGGNHNDGKIKITYANWNLGAPDAETPNMERLMIEAFEAANPDIDVVLSNVQKYLVQPMTYLGANF